jgi:hypothetical protein
VKMVLLAAFLVRHSIPPLWGSIPTLFFFFF